MNVEMKPIGYVSTAAKEIPRSWTISQIKGSLIIDKIYLEGLTDIEPGQQIYVLFHFHKSKKFTNDFLRIKPPVRDRKMGVFSTHSPFRPNPIGLSVLEVIGVGGNVIHVKGLDMLDKTPILDIKPKEHPV
ncbi:MAG: tRNA (N6-threonylcarbamoyladenosine(37)-N6)-methyltransferase TrmO [Deltaproteobacteria bacterium]|nr:tRNA (N6-threonylcarbamoyladenosine(37)-N6)-methyltransferase TrmO [Deltaproteobacteria bacterium]